VQGDRKALRDIARDDVVRGLQAAYNEAREQGNPLTMIAAMREIGKMLGYYRGVCCTCPYQKPYPAAFSPDISAGI
jgi:hypothetical protein